MFFIPYFIELSKSTHIEYFILPFAFTLFNIYFLFSKMDSDYINMIGKVFEYITLLGGAFITLLAIDKSNISSSDWNEVIEDTKYHTPIWTGGLLTILVFLFLGIICYIILSYIKVQNTSPIFSIFLISGIYFEITICLLLIIQLLSYDWINLLICFLPLNFIIISIKTVRSNMLDWKKIHKKIFKKSDFFYYKFSNSSYWPIISIFFMIIIFSFVVCILFLFNQNIYSFIKAWTNTSDWNLSVH